MLTLKTISGAIIDKYIWAIRSSLGLFRLFSGAESSAPHETFGNGTFSGLQ